MIKERFNEIRSYVFAEKEDFPLEHRIFLSAIVVGLLVSLLGGAVNYILAPSLIAVMIPLLLSSFLIIIYYFVRLKKIFTPFVTPIIIVAIFGISTIWIFNGGINGSNIMPAFLILILGVLVVPVKTKKYIIILFIALNIFVLLIQLYRPDIIINFPNETDRWIDYLITLIYSSYFTYTTIRFVHKNYTLERLKAEQGEIRLQQLNADKDRFISILGHDLKSPFNNLLGLSEVLTEDIRKLNIDEIDSIAKDINKTAKRTYKLLEEILMWANAHQGKIPFNPQNLNFKDICKNNLEIFIPDAVTKNIIINCTPTDEINMCADIDMLKTVMRNLISNAIKFTNNGEIKISAQQTDSDITISVSDNGVGIAPEDLPKLFDISKVLTTKGTAGESGTGLGLLLCKEFVEKHGGNIWVESKVGKGSEFKFTIPVFSRQNPDCPG